MTAEQIRDEDQVINEARALSQQGRNNRPKRLRFESGNYNQQILDRLFIDNMHKNLED